MSTKIRSAQVMLASYSKHRTKSKMSAKALKTAFMAGADFFAMSINGSPCQTYCSCRDFAPEATIEILESVDGFMTSVCYFTLTHNA